MYIKSIVLDGFKSYGHRVEITGFDKEFNAITGLNGTGKSNILDSICFVLGITNLSNVRASSLQELIYKHGQAGITKATVSITFDNRDKSPIGYENHNEITVTRQVVMGGKNKYLINGINVQNKRVSDLFCSVQLNVNNPHFLIMQGRITKVLNMKPPEILSMVEEAAGTRMYEAKKQAAQKTIEKKDAKLKELNDIITEDIAPKIQHLQDEKAQFQEYQKVVRELDNLSKLHVAYKYVTGQEMSVEAQSKVTEVQDDIKSTKEVIKNNEKEVKQLDAKIVDLTKKLEEESGAAVSQLTSAAAALSRAEAEAQAAQAAQRGARDALRSHRTRARLLERARADDDAALRDKQAALAEVSAAFEGMRLASETSEAALSAAQDKFVAVSTGEDDGSGSLQDRLMAAMTTASEASMHSEQVAMELTQATKRLRTLEREFSSISGQYQRDQDTIANYQVQLDQLKPQLAALQPSVARCASARAEARRLGLAARAHRDALELHEAPLQRCQFDYHPPDHNFDHGRVYGTICKLLEVRDPVYSTALETAAGGRLYNVVVDTEVTSKLLLDRGRLQSRRIIIPLNKISGPVMDPQTLRIAQEIGGGSANVQLALELVTFPAAVQAAMAWVFGNTLVCRDLDTAKRVTFHPRVRRRCVTLDGDVFDPSGTLTGGARIQGGSVLVQLAEQRAREQQLAAVEAQLAECSQQLLVDLQRKADTYNDMQQRYELLAHELGVVTARNETTAYAETHDEIENLRVKVAELTAALEQAKIKEKETAAVALELEEKVKDIKGHRERQLKKAKEELKQAKALAARHGGDWRQHQQELEALRLEVAALAADGAAARAQLADAARLDDELLQQLDRARADHESATSKVKDIQAQIKRQKAEMSSKNSDIAKLIQKKDNLTKINCDLQLKIKELEYKVTELKAEAVECQNRISALESEHPWIASERAYFGSAGGLYDLEARGAHVAGARVLQLRARRERLARGLNARAHTLLSQKEDQYQDVMRKKRIVEADRAKLVEVMSELDEMKKKTLVTAYEQVNKDFASIFATLLPGAQARLRPPDGLTELDGLEVNVGFNNIWKESLGELSGGQRSLVALSLVLAMLLFKPAPLYILDEVDAALDLSHTQNIGQMLKNHFKHSQFIIVSLKDGMFNNANVLFRTKFVDGMSSVQRTVNATR